MTDDENLEDTTFKNKINREFIKIESFVENLCKNLAIDNSN